MILQLLRTDHQASLEIIKKTPSCQPSKSSSCSMLDDNLKIINLYINYIFCFKLTINYGAQTLKYCYFLTQRNHTDMDATQSLNIEYIRTGTSRLKAIHSEYNLRAIKSWINRYYSISDNVRNCMVETISDQILININKSSFALTNEVKFQLHNKFKLNCILYLNNRIKRCLPTYVYTGPLSIIINEHE